jgi:uncharacterized membrane protein
LLQYCCVVAAAVGLLVLGNRVAAGNLQWFGDADLTVVEAVITEVLDRQEDTVEMSDGTLVTNTDIFFTARLAQGPRAGEVVAAVQNLSSYFMVNAKEVAPKDRVLLLTDGTDWAFSDYVRLYKISGLGLAFVAALIFFGRLKGFNAIFALGFTCAAVFLVFIPAVYTGKNIYAAAVTVCVYAILCTIGIVSGVNRKSAAAALGCLCGVGLTALLTRAMDFFLNLTGVVDQETQFLLYLATDRPIHLRALIFAGILIGACGGVMDVAMSISSALWEVKRNAPGAAFKTLWDSGVNIGRDIMGTMVNTLVLAYISGSLAIVLLLGANAYSLTELLNKEMLIVELLRMFAGSFGLLLTIPATAIVCAGLYGELN